jgi:antitoxin HigA-1
MPEEIKITRRKMPPVHPGSVLRDDVIPALNISVSKASEELGLSRQTLHRILRGELGVSVETAVRLGKWCGNGPGLWLRMQQAYDLWHTQAAMVKELELIPSHAVA